MNIIQFRDMYQTDYNLKHLFAMNQKWKNRSSFSMWDAPRKTSALLFYRNCSAVYDFPNGDSLSVKCGSLVYLPQGSQYITHFYNCQADTIHTQLLEFELTDDKGNPFAALKHVTILDSLHFRYYVEIFDEFNAIYSSTPYALSLMKSKVYALLHEICNSFHYEKIYSKTFLPIAKGILYMEQNISYDQSIAEIARMCNVSDSCFRRLFQQYSGISPSEYKMQKLIHQAKALLRSGNMTVSEVSSQLGFDDPSYFSRVFKRKTGLTPREYSVQFYQ